MYSDCRNEDIRGLKYPTDANGCELNDVPRFFRGDGPACQLSWSAKKWEVSMLGVSSKL